MNEKGRVIDVNHRLVRVVDFGGVVMNEGVVDGVGFGVGGGGGGPDVGQGRHGHGHGHASVRERSGREMLKGVLKKSVSARA